MSNARQENRKKIEEDADVNMTPMVDVVFLLIIFFLCIEFKVLEAKLPAYLPKDVGSHDHEVTPKEKLRIKIVCDEFGTKEPRPGDGRLRAWEDERPYRLVGHRVHYMVGPEEVATLDELKERLTRLRPDAVVPDEESGGTKPMEVVVEPGFRTVYGDVAPVVDAVVAAGYQDIQFGGGLGSRRTGRRAHGR